MTAVKKPRQRITRWEAWWVGRFQPGMDILHVRARMGSAASLDSQIKVHVDAVHILRY